MIVSGISENFIFATKIMTRLTAALFATSLSCVAAYPGVANLDVLLKRTEPAPRDPAFIIDRPNTGLPPSGFNADDQFVDTSDGSAHEWQAPVAGRDGSSPQDYQSSRSLY